MLKLLCTCEVIKSFKGVDCYADKRRFASNPRVDKRKNFRIKKRLKTELRTEIQASEERTKPEIMVYIEHTAEKQIKTLAEGHFDLHRDIKDLLQQDRKISDLQDRMFAVALK